MKVLLEIKDEKADSLLELLQSLPYVKAQTLTKAKAKAMEDLKESIHQVNRAKKGKTSLKTIESLLNEL